LRQNINTPDTGKDDNLKQNQPCFTIFSNTSNNI